MGNTNLSIKKYRRSPPGPSPDSPPPPHPDRLSVRNRSNNSHHVPSLSSAVGCDQKVAFTKQELKAMHKYLPDFIMDKPSTRQQVEIILNHWDELNLFHEKQPRRTSFNASVLPNAGAAVAALTNAASVGEAAKGDASASAAAAVAPGAGGGITRIVQLFDNFYEFLFAIAPELRPLFKTSIQFKGRALMNIVGGIKGLLQSEHVVDKAARIAFRHVEYGVTCKHFNPLGIALMKTLHSLAPDLWVEATAHAWRVVFCHVSVLVLVRLDKAIRKKTWHVKHPWLAAITDRMAKYLRRRKHPDRQDGQQRSQFTSRDSTGGHSTGTGGRDNTSMGYSTAQRVSSFAGHDNARSRRSVRESSEDLVHLATTPSIRVGSFAATASSTITALDHLPQTCPVSGQTTVALFHAKANKDTETDSAATSISCAKDTKDVKDVAHHHSAPSLVVQTELLRRKSVSGCPHLQNPNVVVPEE